MAGVQRYLSRVSVFAPSLYTMMIGLILQRPKHRRRMGKFMVGRFGDHTIGEPMQRLQHVIVVEKFIRSGHRNTRLSNRLPKPYDLGQTVRNPRA